jgi:hypothetical protein
LRKGLRNPTLPPTLPLLLLLPLLSPPFPPLPPLLLLLLLLLPWLPWLLLLSRKARSALSSSRCQLICCCSPLTALRRLASRRLSASSWALRTCGVAAQSPPPQRTQWRPRE